MQKIIKLITIIVPVIIVISLITCRTNTKNSNPSKLKSVKTSYFNKGVYKSYSPNKNSNRFYFYIFYDENSGYTEDSEKGIGLPFSCIQTDSSVKFKFGGSEEPEEIFKIKSVKNKMIEGSFEDNQPLIFAPIPNVNPDNFDAIEYKEFSIKGLQEARMTDGIVEPVYTQDCFPKTLQQSGVSKICFEHANLGQNIFCSKSEINSIKEYYKIGQDKDPLNDGSGQFCAD